MAINFRRVLCLLLIFSIQQSAQTGSPQIDVAWLVRPAQSLASIVQSLVGFSALVLVFLMLGLLEVEDFKGKLRTVCPEQFSTPMLQAGKSIADKFRRYAVIRTLASLITGLMVAYCAGDSASSWRRPGASWHSCLTSSPSSGRSWRRCYRRSSPSCSFNPGRRRP